MTELEMALTLGLLNEPVRNKVQMNPLIEAEILYLKHIFVINQTQRKEIGSVNGDIWADLLPWHSLN
ncbi:MAG: hypothetical protein AB7P76_06015 [Candidatus Melainabacteria bacterium]